jgi:pyrroloquinoline quinone biosynthesis protein B
VLVLGAAAGGGVPQWNCACPICAAARAGNGGVAPATQASVAVSGNGADWLVVGASPDLRQQAAANVALHPRQAGRHSPIAGVVLVSADVDGIAGLLVLRERQAFTLYAPQPILDVLEENPIFRVLDPALVQRVALVPGESVPTAAGVAVTLVALPGKTPLFRERPGADAAEPAPSYAAMLRTAERCVLVAPACAEITDEVRDVLSAADLVLFDGTLFTDDEMQRAGLGGKTARRMGHVPMSGPGGSLERLRDLGARRVYFHINNSNPVLCLDSPERAMAREAGFEIARDGMEIRL